MAPKILHSTLSLIGAGRLGGALAIALERRGLVIKNVVSRTLESAGRLAAQLNSAPQIFAAENLADFEFSEIILIATPDPAIEVTAARLARLSVPSPTIFLHTSGALSSSAVLRSLRDVGGLTGSLHPLVSISDAMLGAEKFAGVYFCLEGEREAVRAAETIVETLAGNAFSISSEQKPLYHAAAVMSSGHLIALFDLAIQTLADCGLESQEARKVLLPLVQSTVENLASQTPAAALTGTFARADLETMKNHLAALRDKPAALAVYIELGKQSLRLAAARGADRETISAMLLELESL